MSGDAEQAPPREELGLDAIRLLAHPLRRRMEHELRKGPVTATSLARALGENTGLTSYHLRQLAKHGFVEEVPGHGRGRERWWRFVPKDRRFPDRPAQSPQLRAVLDELMHTELVADVAEFADALSGHDGALPYSRSTITVTTAELQDFFEDYIRLLYRYKRPPADTPPGAEHVQVRLFAYPTPPEN